MWNLLSPLCKTFKKWNVCVFYGWQLRRFLFNRAYVEITGRSLSLLHTALGVFPANAWSWEYARAGLFVGMRRYGDITIQYRYVGPRYVSWPNAVYRDTTLTYIIRGSHCVVTVFSVFNRFKILLLKTFTFLIWKQCLIFKQSSQTLFI